MSCFWAKPNFVDRASKYYFWYQDIKIATYNIVHVQTVDKTTDQESTCRPWQICGAFWQYSRVRTNFPENEQQMWLSEFILNAIFNSCNWPKVKDNNLTFIDVAYLLNFEKWDQILPVQTISTVCNFHIKYKISKTYHLLTKSTKFWL